MYLKQVASKEPQPELGQHFHAMEAMRASGMPVPGLYQLLNFRPRAGRHLSNWIDEVMRGPGALPPDFREHIAAWTSARNQCRF